VTIFELRLRQHGRARIAFGGDDRLPAHAALGVLRATVDAGARRQEPLTVSVEATVPRGGKCDYGLLGLAFAPSNTAKLEIEIAWTDNSGPRVDGALSTGDQVREGLPQSYAAAALERLAKVLIQPPPGRIRVVQWAHGEVGSSSHFFASIANVGAELLFRPPSWSELELRELCERLLV
jgi:hypothetical protein